MVTRLLKFLMWGLTFVTCLVTMDFKKGIIFSNSLS
jgi:hypothetical protein